MKILKKLLVSSLICLATSANLAFGYSSDLIQANIQSLRIPANTKMKIRMESPINTLNSRIGESFLASILEDIRVDGNVVIPAGTTIRGRVGNIDRNGYLSKGGSLKLNFDHLVTPVGRQISINTKISNATNLLSTGELATGENYVNLLGKNFDKAIDKSVSITGYGVKKGLSVAGGIPVIITAPVAATGGAVFSSGDFFVKSVVAVFKKGKNIIVNPGDIFEISLNEPVDIPAS